MKTLLEEVLLYRLMSSYKTHTFVLQNLVHVYIKTLGGPAINQTNVLILFVKMWNAVAREAYWRFVSCTWLRVCVSVPSIWMHVLGHFYSSCVDSHFCAKALVQIFENGNNHIFFKIKIVLNTCNNIYVQNNRYFSFKGAWGVGGRGGGGQPLFHINWQDRLPL